MGKDAKIAGYVFKMHNHVHLMKGCGKVLTDNMIVKKITRTLTSHFDHVIVAIQESTNIETLKFEDLVGLLEAHELRIIERKKGLRFDTSTTGSDIKEAWWFQQVQRQRR